MARMTARIGLGTLGLLAGLGAPRLAAQSWALPASDPVNIARSGTGVAYGNNLEAAALNPALLATLREGNGAYLASAWRCRPPRPPSRPTERPLQPDRNRYLPALGAAWRLDPTLVLGLKVDQPFMRHAEMPITYSGRFLGEAFDLTTQAGGGSARLGGHPQLGVRRQPGRHAHPVFLGQPDPYGGPSSPANAPLGLMETDLHQDGSKTAPSYSLGFRWAPNSRWTLAGVYVGAIKATLPLAASYGSQPPCYTYLDGVAHAPAGTAGRGPSPPRPGWLRQRRHHPARQAHPRRAPAGEPGLHLGSGRALPAGGPDDLPGHPAASPAGGGAVSGSGEGTRFTSGLGVNLMG